MKYLLLVSAFLTLPTFAQAIDLATLKQMIISKKDVLEMVNAGMSKKLTTLGKIQVENSVCNYKQTSTQTILKILADKILILSQESFNPAVGAACASAGYVSQKQNLLYYESKPSITEDLSDLDQSASSITTILQNGNLVTINMTVSDVDQETNTTFSDNVSIQYDYSKPSFKNTLTTKGNDYSIATTDMPDTDISKLDLTKVRFCDNNDGDESDCTPEGNYSDILFQ